MYPNLLNTNLKIKVAQPVVQIQRNQIFNFLEPVKFGIIMASEERTFKLSLQSVQIGITYRKSTPSHYSVNIGIDSTKKNELKEEYHAWLHVPPSRQSLAKDKG